MAQAGRRVIAVHLVIMLYGHGAVNDPRGSGSDHFIDDKFEPLGPIRFGRKPRHQQPTRPELKAFHAAHEELLNFPIFWIDDAKRQQIAEAIREVIRAQGYTCYACAICGNHVHLIIRTHRHDALTMWTHVADGIRQRLRLRFPEEISPHHPVVSARPYKVFMYDPDGVWDRIGYVEQNPLKENLPPQRWEFVTPYDDFPFHKHEDAKARVEAKAQANARALALAVANRRRTERTRATTDEESPTLLGVPPPVPRRAAGLAEKRAVT